MSVESKQAGVMFYDRKTAPAVQFLTTDEEGQAILAEMENPGDRRALIEAVSVVLQQPTIEGDTRTVPARI